MPKTTRYPKLKELLIEVKDHEDLTYRSIPFYERVIRDIKVELIKITSEQGEQLSQDVSDATRHIMVTYREDLMNIQSYPKEIPKYLQRVRTTILTRLAFAEK